DRHVAEMRSNAFSPSSSLLPLTSLHLDEWPEAREATRIAIHVDRLDDWAAEHGGVQRPLLVKIDVQGFEDQVIDGGLSTILKAQWLAVEVSFHELYENQPLFDDIYKLLARHGFRYRGNVQQFLNRTGDRVLFADALFENSRLRTL
ncbi:MAG: FkbM family methyltransferase, partial [Synechococcaceae cyanobacterium]|nr:FkbM family methyltransferase [Synechococcaceae cyanobacterium]